MELTSGYQALLALLALTQILYAAPDASPPNELTRLQASYTNAVAAVEAKYKALQMNTPGQYLQGLDNLEKAYQQKGDFKALMAVRE
jgi:hypothetical protein